MRAFSLSRMRPLGLALSLALAYPVAQGLPQGAQVVNGQVTINPGLIQQGSDKAIVNWQSFSIAAGETLRVQQPGVNSVLLNRVVGGDPSLILGQLQANGRVFLVNPRGIVFGRGSQVDAGSLVASTLDLSDTAFLAGNYRFSAGPGAGGLQADGSINAPGGTVALVAPQLSVGGSIAARRVGLGAASTVQVDVEGDGLVLFNLRTDDDRDISLKFNGRVQAEASAEVRAQARGGAAGQVLNMDGIVQARGLRQQGGRIVIDGGTAGITSVNGQADASGETGGGVTVLGQKLALLDAARLDASGRFGGGVLQVGGGFEGQGTEHNAERTWIGAGAELRADATEQGDGGRVAVWADGRTDMLGSIYARGGRLGGNGGMVETSGRQQLNLAGSVDASAPRGRAGQWLLDPNDIVIKSNGGSNTNVGAAPNFASTDDGAVVDVGVLNAALTGGTAVTVQTTASGANTEHGDIDVQAAITSAGTATLNLIASRNISFSTGSVTAGGGPLTLSLQAGGNITGTSLNTGGGALSATSTGGTVALGSVTSTGLNITSGGGDVTLPTGTITGNVSVNSGGGNITQAGALAVTGTTGVTAGAGDITMTAGSNNLQGAVSLTSTGTTQISNGSNHALILGALSTHDLTVGTSSADLNLGSGTITGNLVVTTGGGNLTQAGALTVTGTSGINTGAGDITLTSANNLAGAVSLTSTGTSQVSNGAHVLSLGTLSTHALTVSTSNADLDLGQGTVTGALSVTTGGGTVTQSGALTVTGTTGVNAGAGDITLTSANNLQGAVSLTSTGTSQVTNGNNHNLALGTLSTHALTVTTSSADLDLGAGTVTGALTVATGGGNLTQTGALTVTGASGITTGSGDITLTAANNLQGAVSLTTTGTSQVSNGAHALTLGTLSTRALTVSTSNADLDLGQGTVNGALSVTTGGGAVTQTGALTVTGTAGINAGAGDITLTAANNLQGAVSLTSTGTSQVTNGNNHNLTLGTLSTHALTVTTSSADLDLGQGTVTGALTAATAGGNLTQTGALTVTGATGLNTGAGDITLTTAGNNLQGAIGITTTGITQLGNGSGNALTLGTLSTRRLTVSTSNADLNLGSGTVTGNLSATSGGGSISQGGALTVTGTSGIDAGAGDITLTSANNLQGVVTLTSTGSSQLNNGSHALSLGTLSTHGLTVTTSNADIDFSGGTVTGALSVTTAGGAVTQSGALTVTGTSSFNAGAGDITLTTANNNLQGAISLTSTGTTQVSNGNGRALTLGTLNIQGLTVSTTGGADLNLGSGTISGNLVATSNGGAITQSGALTVTGTSGLNAGAGDITLTAANNLQGAVSLTSTGTTQVSNGAHALTLGTLSTHALTVNTSNAALDLGSGTVTGALSATTAGGAITQTGALTVTGATGLNAGAGDITLTTAGNNLAGAVSLTSTGTTQIANGNGHALTLGTLSTHALTVTTSAADLDLGQGSVAGALVVNSGGGNVTQTGALTVTGTSGITSGAGDITLTQANNLQGAVGLTSTGTTQLGNGAGHSLTLGTLSTHALTVSTSNADLNLGSGSIAGNLGVTTAGGSVTQGGALTVTGTTGLSVGAGDITLTAANNLQGAVTLTSTGTTQVSNGAGHALTLGTINTHGLTVSTSAAGLNLGSGTVTGNLSATSSGGTISQGGALTVTGTSGIDAGAGNITLTSANNLAGAVDLTSTGTTQVTNGSGHTLTLGTLSTHDLTATTSNAALNLGSGSITGNLVATSGGGNISQGGALTVTGSSGLNAGAGDITLTSANNLVGAVNLTSTGTTQVSNGAGHALTLGTLSTHALTASTNAADLSLGSGTVTGALSVSTNGGTVTQGGALTVTGTTGITTGAGDITLTAANNLQGAVSLTSTGTTQVGNGGSNALTLGTLNTGNLTVNTAGGTLNLGGGSVTGTLDANSNGGTISQTGALSVSGITTLNATTAGDISLTNTSNVWHGLNLTGNSLDLRSGGDLEILSLTQPANRALTLSAGGNLILGPAASIDTGTADLKLVSLGGSFTMGGVLAGNNVELQALTGLVLSQDITATGTLKLTTASGDINQTGGTLHATGATTVSAGSSAISLNQATNHFGAAVNLSGGVTGITDSGALTLGTLATGDLTVTSTGALKLGQGTVTGTLNATSNGFAITQTAGLTLTGATTLDAGSADITLNDASNDLQGAITATAGAVSLRSANNLNLFALTQTPNKGLELEAGGTLVLPAGTSNIDTGTEALKLSSGGVFATFGTLKGGDVTLKGQSATLAHDITASGALVVTTTSGSINQTGGRISAAGTSSFDAGAQSITLNGALNDFQGLVTLTGGAAQIVSQHGLSLDALHVTGLQAQAGGALLLGSGTLSGNLSATANGAITQAAGGLQVTGTSSFSAGGNAITLLDNANSWTGAVTLNGGTAQLKSTGAVLLGGGSVASLALTTGGAVTQNAGLTVTGALGVNAGSTAITLNNVGNHLNGTVTLTGGTTQVRTAGALALGTLSTGALTAQSSGNLNLGQGNVGGNLSAVSGGGTITQSGVLSVTGTADIQAGAGSVTLTQGGNQWGGALSLGGGTTQVTSNTGLTLGTLSVGALTVNATGPLGLGQGTVGGSLTANSHGGVITQSGALDVTGMAQLTSGGASITLNQAGNQWRNVVSLSGAATQIRSAAGLTLGTLSTGNLDATSAGALNLGQGTIAGNLNAASGGSAITQTGALQVNGNATLNAGGANITLTNTGNQLLGALSLTGNAVALFNQPSLVLGTLSFNSLDATSNGSITLGSGSLSGSLTARALGGTVTQTAGGLTVAGTTTLQASAGITMTEANHLQGLVHLSGGATSLSNATSLRLGTVATGALTLSAGGSLDLGSGTVGGSLSATSSGPLTQTGALSINGTSALDAGGAPITLTQAGNAFAGAVSLRGGSTSLTNSGALGLGSLSVGDLTVSSNGALQLGSGTVGGVLDANSHGSAITQASGGLSVGGASTLNAGGASITLADAANAFTGLVNLQASDVNLASGSALHLGSFTVNKLTVSAGGNVDLGGGTVNSDLSATTRGTRIGQTGALTVRGNSTFIADGGLVDLVLDQAGNQLLGSINMHGVNGGSFVSADISSALDLSFSGDVKTLKLSSGGLLTLGGGQSTTLTAAANRGIVQTGALKVSGLTTLVAQGGAAMPVDLSNAGNDLNRVQLAAQAGGSLGRVQIREGDAVRHDGLQLGGDAASLEIASAGALDFGGGSYGSLMADTSAGSAAITQSGALSVSGLATLKAGAGAITLTRADNNWLGLVDISGGPAQLTGAGALTLGNLVTGSFTAASTGALNLGQGTVSGDLLASSGGNPITQTGALQLGGKASVDAGGADVMLAHTGNQLVGTIDLNARDATLFSQPGLNFGTLTLRNLDATSGGGIALGTGSLSGTLTARGGAITQAAGGLAVAGSSTLQATGDITLADAANQFNGLVNIGGGTTVLTNASDLRLGSVATGGLTLNIAGALDLGAGQIGGELKATSRGAITQTGALAVGGGATLDAGGTAITLDQVGNAFAGLVNLSGGNTMLVNGGALSLGTLQVADLTVSSSGALQLGTGTVGGALKANSGGGAISQAAGGLSIGSTTTLDAGSAAITLEDPANAFAGLIHLQGGNVSLVGSGALRLGSIVTRDLKLDAGGDIGLGSGAVSGDLTARTGGATIGQSGALSVHGASNFIANGGLVDVVLDQPGNQLLGPLSLRGENGGSFVGADISSLLDLSFSGDVQTLNLVSAGLLTLGGGRSTTLTAAAAKGIGQTGALEVSGLTTLVARGATLAVDLSHAGNDLGTVVLQTPPGGSFGRVQLRDGDAARQDGLKVSGDAASLEITSAGALDLGGGRYTHLLADTGATGAAITQSLALAVSGLATLKAGSGDIALARADNALGSLAVGSAGTAHLVSAGDYTVNASSVVTQLELGGPGAISLVGPLSGTGELVMSGTGSLTVSSAQSYAGGTRIRTGTLVLQGPAAQLGSGTVQLGATGLLDLRDDALLPNALLAQGGSVLNTSGRGTLSGPVTLQATTAFLPGAGGLAVSGAISDGGAGLGLRLAGNGMLTLAGSNNFSGTTDIAAGTLRATGIGALSSTSAVQLAANAVLALGQDQTAGSLSGAGRVELGRFTLATGADGRDTTFSGSIGGSGGLTKLGSGRFTLSGSGTQTGASRVAAGELVLASSTALNDVTAVSVDAGATLTVQQSANIGSLAGAGTVDLQAPLLAVGSNGSSTRWSGAITGSGGLAKRGMGVFTLAGHNSFAGDASVEAGTLQLEGSGPRRLAAGTPTGPVVPGTVGIDVASGSTLELLTDIDLGALTGAGQVQLNAATLTVGVSGRSGRFDGVMAGSGGLTKAGSGTLTLGGANVYTGATAVTGGTLDLAAAQALSVSSALSIDTPARVVVDAHQAVASLNGNGDLVLNGANLAAGAGGGDSRFDGVVSGSGGLVKQGTGMLTLTAANTQSGVTSIEAGTVKLTDKGSLGSGEIQNQGQLLLARSDAFTLDQAVSGRGSLVIAQGQVTLGNGGNSYSGATQVQGGALITTAAERLPDATDVQLAAGAQLQLGGNETIASLQAAGGVRLAGDLTTRGQQVYTGSLTLANGAGLTLSGTLIDASHSSNQFAGTPLGLNGGQALVTVKETLQLGNVTLSNGGRVEAERLALNGKLQLTGGSLDLVATAAPDDARATPQGTAQVPLAGLAMAFAEATVQQGSNGAITVADGAKLAVQAAGGGSVLLTQDANNFQGQLSVLSGSKFDAAWVPNAKGSQAIQSLVHVAGQQVMVGGSGIEADVVHIRAELLATLGGSKLVARLPFDEIVLGKALSAPGMTLELAPGAFGKVGSFGSVSGLPLQVEVGSTSTGARTSGPNAGYLTVLPKAGVQGQTAIVLTGPKVGSQEASGGTGYRFFHDGASQATEIPVIYNGVLPLTPAASGAISSINGDAEDARRARFQETVRTENVTVRLRSGVIAEVGPGRPSTQGSEGARPPEPCDPALQPVLSCKPPVAP